jgi:hypothetical protein
MSRLRDRQIDVVATPEGRPRAFHWRGRQVTVREVLDAWEEAGCWWLGEEPRHVYRVLATHGAAYELHHQLSSGWRVHRVFD